MPYDATNPDVRTSMGSALYAPENDALVWKIKSFPGGKVQVENYIVASCTNKLCACSVLSCFFVFIFVF